MAKKYTRHDQAHWRQLVEQQALSGLSGAKFCREQDIRYASFMSWRKRLHESNTDLSAAPPVNSFIELTTPAQISDISHTSAPEDSILCVELSLGAGIELRISRHR